MHKIFFELFTEKYGLTDIGKNPGEGER